MEFLSEEERHAQGNLPRDSFFQKIVDMATNKVIDVWEKAGELLEEAGDVWDD